MDTVREICLVAPSATLAERAKGVIDQMGMHVDVFIAALDDAAQMAEDLVARGARVLISRKGTKALMEKALNVTVVGIANTLEDYVQPLQALKEESGKIGFLIYEELSSDVAVLCRMLGKNFGVYHFSTKRDTPACVERALKDGVTVAIGGVTTARYAQQVGLRHITLENSETSIRTAIEVARQILEVQREEARKQEELSVRLKRYELIFNYTHDAIIAVDRQGRIDVLNQVAKEIMHDHDHGSFVGENIDDVLSNTRMLSVLKSGEAELDQLMDINGTLVSTNRIPIVMDGMVYGAVATFQDVKRIQASEQKIRIKMHEKGLRAKYSFADILGGSPELLKTKSMAKSYAKSNSTILIRGETGTGKELFAQSIHRASQRRDRQFVAINCAALPKNLLEAELFGYEEGAFTGAAKGGKAGLFEIAHGGTIFLDEIGELAIDTQVQLLRVLQEKEIRRIGSDRVTPVDIRVITATNRDLENAIAQGRFRQDLFYRLNVLNIYIPPLRERREDIYKIALAFFRRRKGPPDGEPVLAELLDRLRQYPWPGNVRELQNFVERVCALLGTGASAEQLAALAFELSRNVTSTESEKINPSEVGENGSLALWERDRIVNALKKHGLSIQLAAKELGVSRTTLWRQMKKFNIKE